MIWVKSFYPLHWAKESECWCCTSPHGVSVLPSGDAGGGSSKWPKPIHTELLLRSKVTTNHEIIYLYADGIVINSRIWNRTYTHIFTYIKAYMVLHPFPRRIQQIRPSRIIQTFYVKTCLLMCNVWGLWHRMLLSQLQRSCLSFGCTIGLIGFGFLILGKDIERLIV